MLPVFVRRFLVDRQAFNVEPQGRTCVLDGAGGHSVDGIDTSGSYVDRTREIRHGASVVSIDSTGSADVSIKNAKIDMLLRRVDRIDGLSACYRCFLL